MTAERAIVSARLVRPGARIVPHRRFHARAALFIRGQVNARRSSSLVLRCSRSNGRARRSDCRRDRGRKLGEVRSVAALAGERQAQHLIEVAIVDVALPVDGEERTAHDRLEVLRLIRVLGQRHVFLEAALGDERAAEALDGHIRQDVEAIERDAERLREPLAIMLTRAALARRQGRSLRVVDQVQRESRVRHAVAESIERLKRSDTPGEHTFAALCIDVLFEITGQGGDDFHLVRSQEMPRDRPAPALAGSSVAAVHHVCAERAGRFDEIAEMRLSSGAPPVISSVPTSEAHRNAITVSGTSRCMLSLRFGPAFTWQCRQV